MSKTYNPFPGLRSFRTDEKYLFFGREDHTAELLRRLRETRFLAVVGTSGSGKSSLVKAGVLPELHKGTMTRAGSSWEVAVMRPGGSPMTNLAKSLIEADLYDPEQPDILEQVRATLSRSRQGLIEAARQSDLEDGANLLVVVDQFEELFRFRRSGAAEDRSEAIRFVELLLAASRAESPSIYVVLTMRSDYLGDCTTFPGLAEAVNAAEYLIPRMNREQRRAAIEGPVKVAGAAMAPRLLQKLLNDLGDEPDQLPILQHALMRTWNVWADVGDSEALDLDDYQRVGRMDEALSLHADEVYQALSSDKEREWCRGIFEALTDQESENRGIRRPQRLAAIANILEVPVEQLIPVIDAFRKQGVTFLMPSQEVELNGDTVIDISHESLMRVWGRLRTWVEEEAQAAAIYRRVAENAVLHARGEAGLFRDPELGLALSWLERARHPNAAWASRYHPGFTEAIAFLEESKQAAEAEELEHEQARKRELEQAKQLAEAERLRAEDQKRAAGRLRWLVAGSLALAAAAVIALFAAQRAERKADAARGRAEESQAETKAALAVADSAKQKAEDAEREAKDAEQSSRQTLYVTDLQLAGMLFDDERSTIQQIKDRLRHHDPVTNPNLEPADDLRDFEWYYLNRKVAGAGQVRDLNRIEQPVIDCVGTPEGGVVTLDQGGKLQRWDPSTGQEVSLAVDLKQGRELGTMALAPDGKRAALAIGEKVHLVDTLSGAPLIAPIDAQARIGMIFSPDGAMLITVDSKISCWDGTSGELIAERNSGIVTNPRPVSISFDGLTLAVGCIDTPQSGTSAFSVFRLPGKLASSDDLLKLIPPDSEWKFLHPTDGVDPAETDPDFHSTFATLDFDDSAWTTGKDGAGAKGGFGYGDDWMTDGVDIGSPKNRDLGKSAYFRHRFTTDQEFDSLSLECQRDDGIIVYLDGVEVARDNMEAGEEAYGLRAQAAVSEPAEMEVFRISLKGKLAAGEHVLAISLHNRYPSSDLRIGGITLLEGGPPPPEIGRLQDKRYANLGGTGTMAISPDGESILGSQLFASRIQRNAVSTGSPVEYDGKQHVSPISAIAFNPGGTQMATAAVDGTIKIWENFQNFGEARTERLRGAAGKVNQLVFVSGGRRLVSIGEDNSARIWDLGNDGDVAHGGLRIRFSPDGRFYAASNFGGRYLQVRDTTNGKILRQLDRGERLSQASDTVAFSPDNRLMAAGFSWKDELSYIELWDIDRGERVASLSGASVIPDFPIDEHSARIASLAFSPDGRYLVAGFGSFQVLTYGNRGNFSLLVYDVAERRLIKQLQGHRNYCVAVVFSPDGSRLASCGYDGTARIWDTAKWEELHVLKNPDEESESGHKRVADVAFSPDGQMLAMASQETNVHLWSTATGAHLDTLEGHSNAVQAVAFSPDGRTLASGGRDSVARLWNLADRREIIALEASAEIYSLRFSPDGRQLVAGGYTAHLWSAWPVAEDPADRLAKQLADVMESRAGFTSRIRMLSEDANLIEALEKLSTKNPASIPVQAALSAARSNRHAASGKWKLAVEELDRLKALDSDPPRSWLRTPGLLRLATALVHQDRPIEAAPLIAGGAERRIAEGLPKAHKSGGASVHELRALAARFGITRVSELSDAEVIELAASLDLPVADVSDRELGTLSALIEDRLKEDPDHTGLLELRGALAGQWAGFADQISDYSRAIDRLKSEEPSPATDLQRLHRHRGDAYVSAQLWDKAIADYDKGITPEIEETSHFLHRARAHEALENWDAAAADWSRAVESDPKGAELLAKFARRLETAGQSDLAAGARDRARQMSEAYLKDDPSDPFAIRELADLLLAGEIEKREWTVLAPSKMESQGGATLTLQDDQSILASGTNPRNDVYTVTFATPDGQVSDLLLEAIPEASAPGGGVGRGGAGSVALTGVTVAYLAEPDATPLDLKLTGAFSSIGQAEKAIDGDKSSFWGVYPHYADLHRLNLRLSEVLPTVLGGQFVVRLEFQNQTYATHGLARFRLSAGGGSWDFRRSAAAAATDPTIRLAAAYAWLGKSAESLAWYDRAYQLAETPASRKKFFAALPASMAPEALTTLTEHRPEDPYLKLGLVEALSHRSKVALAAGGDPSSNAGDLERIWDLADQMLKDHPEPEWIVLEPTELRSEGGTTLTVLDDSSILASGENPDSDTYTVVANAELAAISGVRLEALPHPSLPKNGPGRQTSTDVRGGFHLNELSVSSGDAPIELTEIAVDFDEVGQASKVIDGRVDTAVGWSNWPRSGQPNTAVIATTPPSQAEPAELKFRLSLSTSEDRPGSNLGRFRLSVTSAENAVAASQAQVRQGLLAPMTELATALREAGQSKLAAEQRDRTRKLLEGHLEAHPSDTEAIQMLADQLSEDQLFESKWTVLEPSGMKSGGGATLTKLHDHSILVSGVLAAQDTYTVEAPTDLDRVTAFRLEALPHESLPKGGPGRNEANGNFHLNEFRVSVGGEPIPLTGISVTFNQGTGARADQVIDGVADAKQGWNNGFRSGQANTAIISAASFSLAGNPLKFELVHPTVLPKHKLGRFRLSVSDDPGAFDLEQTRHAANKIADPSTRLAAVYALAGKPEESLAWYGRAYGESDAPAARAVFLESLPDGRAPEILEALAKSRPGDPYLQLGLARALSTRADPDSAVQGADPGANVRDLSRAREISDQLLDNYPEPQWTVLKPTKVTSDGGATLTVQADGSILASGLDPVKDRWILSVPISDEQGIAAFRIVGIPDESLPKGGFGRDPNGWSGVTGFMVKNTSAGEPRPDELEPLPLSAPFVSTQRPNVNLGTSSSSFNWDPWPDVREQQSAILETRRLGELPRASSLRVELSGRHLGRLRVEVASSPKAMLAAQVRQELKATSVEDLVALAIAHVSAGDQDAAVSWFGRAYDQADSPEAKRQFLDSIPEDQLRDVLQAITKPRPDESFLQRALAANLADWHASREEWPEAATHFDRLAQLDAGESPQSWLTTRGVLRVARALLEQDQPAAAAMLLSDGAKRRADEGLRALQWGRSYGWALRWNDPDPPADGGVRIREIYAGSPARSLGLLPNDIILEFNGEAIDTGSQARHDELRRSDDPLRITILTPGAASSRQVTVPIRWFLRDEETGEQMYPLIRRLNEVIAKDPTNPGLLEMRAEMSGQRTGSSGIGSQILDYDKAIDQLERQEPTPTSDLRRLYRRRGAAYFALGRWTEAVTDYSRYPIQESGVDDQSAINYALALSNLVLDGYVPGQGKEWTVIKPTEMTSEFGATLTLEDDGAIFVSGENPTQESYTLTAPIGKPGLNGFRLETLPDERLPGGGAGRRSSGNFMLTEILAELLSADSPSASRLTINDAWADWSQAELGLIENAIDSDQGTYWAVNPRFTDPHTAIFTVDSSLDQIPNPSQIRFQLHFKNRTYEQGGLGRFRLSVTDDADVGAILAAESSEDPWVRLAFAAKVASEVLSGGELRPNLRRYLVGSGSLAPPQRLLPRGSVWHYLDDGSDQGTAWRQPDFDDSEWKTGQARLGYDDGSKPNEASPIKTRILFGDDDRNKYITTYFRTAFDLVEEPPDGDPVIFLQRDDGAVVYLNGEEILRSNLPEDEPIDYLTTAPFGQGPQTETIFYQFPLPAESLRPGRNVLAVEIHQVNGRSSDIGFDLELAFIPKPSAAELEQVGAELEEGLAEALESAPPESASALAEFYLAANQFEDAIHASGLGLTYEPENLELLSARARAYEGLQDWQAAADDWDTASQVNPAGFQLLIDFAERLQQSGQGELATAQLDLARDRLDAILEANPDDSEARDALKDLDLIR